MMSGKPVELIGGRRIPLEVNNSFPLPFFFVFSSLLVFFDKSLAHLLDLPKGLNHVQTNSIDLNRYTSTRRMGWLILVMSTQSVS